MLSELQIETIVAETCGTYRTGDSYTFEDVWNCIEKALAAHSAGSQDEKKSCVVQDECVWPVCRRECVIRDSTHPQPIPQTDAARDAKDAKRYRWLREPGNNCITFDRESFPTLHELDAALDAEMDAEIERGEREGDA